MNRPRKALCLAVLIAVAGASLPAAADVGPAINPSIYAVPAGAKTINVDCDARGQTLNGALASAPAGDVNIVFTGTCKEVVYVHRDGVAFRGKDASATVAGGIQLNSAKRILFEGFTCRDNTNLEACLEANLGSSATLHNIKIFNSAARGLLVFHSAALIDGLTIDKTISTSILVRGSHVRLEGEVSLSNTAEGCLVIDSVSNVFSKSATISARDCLMGILIQTNSSFEGPFGELTLNHNTFAGLALITAGTFSYGGSVVAKNNASAGIFVDEGSCYSPFSNLSNTSSTTLENNGLANLYVTRGSMAELNNVLSNTGAPYGVWVDSGIVRIGHSKITGNKTADLRLQFGSRATFLDAVELGRLSCDGTQLLRGPKAACTVVEPEVKKPSAGPAKEGGTKSGKE
jgi:hypothetical protein